MYAYELGDDGGRLSTDEHDVLPSFQRDPTETESVNYIDSATTLVDYFHWTEDYTGHQLSYSTDILNAFAGVGHAFGQTVGSNMIFGIPEKFLPQTLM
jgi:hypothetical protein